MWHNCGYVLYMFKCRGVKSYFHQLLASLVSQHPRSCLYLCSLVCLVRKSSLFSQTEWLVKTFKFHILGRSFICRQLVSITRFLSFPVNCSEHVTTDGFTKAKCCGTCHLGWDNWRRENPFSVSTGHSGCHLAIPKEEVVWNQCQYWGKKFQGGDTYTFEYLGPIMPEALYQKTFALLWVISYFTWSCLPELHFPHLLLKVYWLTVLPIAFSVLGIK